MSEAEARKVATHHLEREACLYVRQSSLRQVMQNTESTRRQYGLSQRATALGWPAERIRVIDEDQGKSGAYSGNRSGFRDLMGSIAAGEVGIVLGLEVSRLARDNADWHQLLRIAGITNTLILDETGIYDPNDGNDKLLLGVKGTMSKWSALHLLSNGKRRVIESWSAPALQTRRARRQSLTISIRSPLRRSMTRGEQQWRCLTRAVHDRERAGTRSMAVLRHSSST